MFAMYSGACFAASQCFRFIRGLPAHLSKYAGKPGLQAAGHPSQPPPTRGLPPILPPYTTSALLQPHQGRTCSTQAAHYAAGLRGLRQAASHLQTYIFELGSARQSKCELSGSSDQPLLDNWRRWAMGVSASAWPGGATWRRRSAALRAMLLPCRTLLSGTLCRDTSSGPVPPGWAPLCRR